MRDFKNFSRRQQSLERAHRRNWPGQNGLGLGLLRKRLLKSCPPNLQLHFQGRKKEEGPGQWHLSQNFLSGYLLMAHQPELQNTAWPSQAAKGAEKIRTELGILPPQTRSGRSWVSKKWTKAVGSATGQNNTKAFTNFPFLQSTYSKSRNDIKVHTHMTEKR